MPRPNRRFLLLAPALFGAAALAAGLHGLPVEEHAGSVDWVDTGARTVNVGGEVFSVDPGTYINFNGSAVTLDRLASFANHAPGTGRAEVESVPRGEERLATHVYALIKFRIGEDDVDGRGSLDAVRTPAVLRGFDLRRSRILVQRPGGPDTESMVIGRLTRLSVDHAAVTLAQLAAMFLPSSVPSLDLIFDPTTGTVHYLNVDVPLGNHDVDVLTVNLGRRTLSVRYITRGFSPRPFTVQLLPGTQIFRNGTLILPSDLRSRTRVRVRAFLGRGGRYAPIVETPIPGP